HQVRIHAPRDGEACIEDLAVNLLDVRAQILQASFDGPTGREIVSPLHAQERQRRRCAVRISHHAAAHHRVCFDFGDLYAECPGQLGAFANEKPVAVRQAEHGQVDFAVDALPGEVRLVVEVDLTCEGRLG